MTQNIDAQAYVRYPNPEFSTRRLQLAIYLHAAGSLPFLRTEPNGDGKLRFVFQDDRHQGAQFEIAYERGATIAARDLFTSQTFLRRKMSEAENRKLGEPIDDIPSYSRR